MGRGQPVNRVVTIDPGLTGTGVAVWDGGELTLAFCVRVAPDADMLPGRISAIVEQVRPTTRSANRIVIEQPQTYQGRAAKGDANDLIKLANLVGALMTLGPQHTTLVLPSEWKGQAPAPVVEARGRERLSFGELEHVDLSCSKKHQTDVWHAVGIGLWYLKRKSPLTKSSDITLDSVE